jgi:hypothetical protein
LERRERKEYVNGEEGFWCFFACCRDLGLGISFDYYLKESFLLQGFEDEEYMLSVPLSPRLVPFVNLCFSVPRPPFLFLFRLILTESSARLRGIFVAQTLLSIPTPRRN